MLGLLAMVPGFGAAYTAAAGIAAALLRCTVCMIAIAVGIAWIAGDIHGHRKEDAAWSAKWSDAEAKAERDRLARDALAKAIIQKNADERIAGVNAREKELQQKVQKYESDEAIRRATGGGAAAVDLCLTDQSDDQWLSDIKRKRRSDAFGRSRLAERLRRHFTARPDASKR